MKCTLKLELRESEEQCILVDLSEMPPDNDRKISADNILFEDCLYRLSVSFTEYTNMPQNCELYINGKKSGSAIFSKDSDFILLLPLDGNSPFKYFSTFYDYVVIKLTVIFEDGAKETYYSNYFLCAEKSSRGKENIITMMNEIISFSDLDISSLLFSPVEPDPGKIIEQGGKYSYKQPDEYLRILEEIIRCYQENFSFIRQMGKHRIDKQEIMQRFDEVSEFSRESFEWIMQNSDKLKENSLKLGIVFNNKYYLPYQILSESSIESWDVYENRILLYFLYTVLLDAQRVYKAWNEQIDEIVVLNNEVQFSTSEDYYVPLISARLFLQKELKNKIERLSDDIEKIQFLQQEYSSLFRLSGKQLTYSPKRTKTFQEVKPYVRTYQLINQWFTDGSISLYGTDFLVHIKTLDKLFEYYCLQRIIKLFVAHGFFALVNTESSKSFIYSIPDASYSDGESVFQNEIDIANTYYLQKEKTRLTIYYQAVVHSDFFENNLSLYRTTNQKAYWTPDFILKFENEGNNNCEYIILDSKFSNRDSIIDNSYDKVITKYFKEIAVENADHILPRMVWILQGRIDENEIDKPFYKRTNSPLARRNTPPSFGIMTFTPLNNDKIDELFWNEMESQISYL